MAAFNSVDVGHAAIQAWGEQVGELSAHVAVKNAVMAEQAKVIDALVVELATATEVITEFEETQVLDTPAVE